MQKSKPENNEVILNIKDTGTGINPEILSRLFTKFATKSDQGGTDWDYIFVKSIIESHGGKIWAEDNSGGNGSTFYFTLPIGKILDKIARNLKNEYKITTYKKKILSS